MLHSFPTPYRNELWYSVMYRHMMRNGSLSTMEGRMKEVSFSVLYDKSIARVVSELPKDTFVVEDLVMKHTLFPYITRTYSFERKKRYLNALIAESISTIRWNASAKIPTCLKYCPICRKEELERYGECYLHREHQLPLVTVCPEHGCRLIWFRNKANRYNALGFEEEPLFDAEPYEKALASISYQYLTDPFHVCPPSENEGLFLALEKGGYASVKKGRMLTVDPELLYMDMLEFYGEKLVKRYFSGQVTHEHLLKIKNWLFEEPERYIMVSALVEKGKDCSFGEVKIHSA